MFCFTISQHIHICFVLRIEYWRDCRHNYRHYCWSSLPATFYWDLHLYWDCYVLQFESDKSAFTPNSCCCNHPSCWSHPPIQTMSMTNICAQPQHPKQPEPPVLYAQPQYPQQPVYKDAQLSFKTPHPPMMLSPLLLTPPSKYL